MMKKEKYKTCHCTGYIVYYIGYKNLRIAQAVKKEHLNSSSNDFFFKYCSHKWSTMYHENLIKIYIKTYGKKARLL